MSASQFTISQVLELINTTRALSVATLTRINRSDDEQGDLFTSQSLSFANAVKTVGKGFSQNEGERTGKA